MTEAFDPRAFWEFAQQISRGAEEDQARLRTAVGRAYYAVFLVARDRLGVTEGQDVHLKVVRILRDMPNQRVVGDWLAALRRLRTVADYELNQGDWRQKWKTAEALYRRLVPYIGSLPPPPRPRGA